jgi:uroporphyrinogen decarboxylase
MTPRQRIASVLAGRRPDRPAASFWRHHPRQEMTGEDLVRVTLEFQRRFHWDLVKINPRAEYHTEAWGNRYAFYDDDHRRPTLIEPRVRSPRDWATLAVLDPTDGVLGVHLRAARRIREALGADVPLVMTVFTPLSIAAELAGVRETPRPGDVVRHGDELERGLDTITETFTRFVRELISAGCDGIFFATTRLGTRAHLNDSDFQRLSRPRDLAVLAASGGATANVLHVCGPRAMLDLTADYPVQLVSWDMRDATNPGPAEIAAQSRRALLGGIAQELTRDVSRGDEVVEQARQTLEAVGSERVVLGAGCVVPMDVDPAVLDRVRQFVERASGPDRRG